MRSLRFIITLAALSALAACEVDSLPAADFGQQEENDVRPNRGDTSDDYIPTPDQDTSESSEDTSDGDNDSDTLDEPEDDSQVTTYPSGEPCDSGADCIGGYCVEHPDGYWACTERCSDPVDCAHLDDYQCRRIEGVSDVIQLCIPNTNYLCRRCSTNSECGRVGNLCVEYSDGSYCGQECDEDVDCPDDFFCSAVGSDARQCVHESLSCNGQPPLTCEEGNLDACEDPPLTCEEGNLDACEDEEPEVCDEVDFMTDIEHCGGCGQTCNFPNSVTTCDEGVCNLHECEGLYLDLDGDPNNGCEYHCEFRDLDIVDTPDDDFRDTNCDGVDGDLSRAVFVRQGASGANDGLTPQTPVGNIQRAIDIAKAEGRAQILIATGSYAVTQPIQLSSGISLYGGYDRDFTSRVDESATINASTGTVVIAADLASPTIIDRVNLYSANARNEGESAIAVIVKDSHSHLELRHLLISAGSGANGEAGLVGPSTAQTGASGNNGVGEHGGSATTVGGGGAGASGVYRDEGPPGTPGEANGSPGGGSAGAGSGRGGLGCGDGDPDPGGDGGHGFKGHRGNDGDGGANIGALLDTGFYSPAGGRSGGQGNMGGGGGGGGAGGGEDANCVVKKHRGTGRGGGSGGGGGYGGNGGSGGGGGGASIGIATFNSIPLLTSVQIETALGGDGGRGGDGGPGGSGGRGGEGAPKTESTQGAGGRGGDGGPGGTGGCGGGGGGGPSIGVFGGGDSAVVLEDVTFLIGEGGSGGARCSSFEDAENAGEPGMRAETYNIAVF